MSDAEVREALSGVRILAEPVGKVLRQLGIGPDLTVEPQAPFRFIHRQLDDGRHVYFVANLSSNGWSVRCGFRVTDVHPELWDPLTGTIRKLPEFEVEGDRTVVPLEFAPRQSWFVVLGGGHAGERRQGRNFPRYHEWSDLQGPWEVSFRGDLGGPPEVVRFEQLTDWSRHPDPRIRCYCGPAVYRVKFVMPPVEGARRVLDLGQVRHLATVRLNGCDLGVVWCALWQVEIESAVVAGTNELEITVVNTWQNRMIGDEWFALDYERRPDGMVRVLPPWLSNTAARTSGRLTFATLSPFRKNDPLVPSGLLGPVRILCVGMDGSGGSPGRPEAALGVERGSTLRSEQTGAAWSVESLVRWMGPNIQVAGTSTMGLVKWLVADYGGAAIGLAGQRADIHRRPGIQSRTGSADGERPSRGHVDEPVVAGVWPQRRVFDGRGW